MILARGFVNIFQRLTTHSSMEKNVKNTIKTYNEIAEIYDRLQYSTDVSEEIVESYLRAFQGHGLLDVGCGPGNDTKVFMDSGLDVSGIDLSERLLKLAKKNVPQSSFLLMDMRRPALKDGSFDGLWVCSSFIHIPRNDARPTLSEFARILKPNGLMFINVIEGEREGMIKSRLYLDKERFFTDYSASEFRNMIEDEGFEIVDEMIGRETKEDAVWINIIARATI
jgi:ubiquinone/menaquinone biosynthesis C-methylase UbiE